MLETQDWLSIRKRIEQCTGGRPGAAIVKITILVQNGQPCVWLEPEIERIEPKRMGMEFIRQIERERRDGTD